MPDRVRALDVGRITAAIDISGRSSLAELIEPSGSANSVVTIADFGGAAHGVRISVGEMGGQANGKHGLRAAAELFEAGRFRIPIQAAFPFELAAKAHALAETGPRQGKIVFTAP